MMETVFYCNKDQIALTTTAKSLQCPECGEAMKEAGYIEWSGNGSRNTTPH